MFPVMPAEMRPEKAPDSSEPLYRKVVRRPSSSRVYQQLR
jgi:hypothetical protein